MLRIPHRQILRLTGPDTLALLERTVTHKVMDWPEGTFRYGALLTPQGKIIADYLAKRVAEGVLIDVHEDAAADLLKRLTMFRLRSQVQLEIASDLAAVTGEKGQPDPRSSDLPPRDILPAADTMDEVDPASWQATRIQAGVPEWGEDYRAAEVFPTDINMDLMNGVDYKKGCFVGQEVASRMKRKGLIRKRTVRLTGESLAPGAEVRAGAALLGTVTSAAGNHALALLRTDRVAKALETGDPLSAGEHPAHLEQTDWLAAELKSHLETPANE